MIHYQLPKLFNYYSRQFYSRLSRNVDSHFVKNLLMIIVEPYTKGFYDFNHDFTS